ncbi:unnamed protein product [Brassica oleracea var. botrytis]
MGTRRSPRYVTNIHHQQDIALLKRWKASLLLSRRLVSVLQQKLAQILSRIIKIAEEFNVAIYMTNQGVELMFISDPKKPAGGHVLAHAITIRLSFRKVKGEQRVCKVFDAPNLPEGEAISF